MLFKDRRDAGRLLASYMKDYKGREGAIVLGLARGGVVVAFEVAQALALPLNVIAPRKIGAPGNPELALGAIMENGKGVFNDSIIRMLSVPRDYLLNEIEKEQNVARRRLAFYRRYAPLSALKDRLVILVDDGIATGSTMLASIEAMRLEEAQYVVAAAPVASDEALNLIERAADEVVCPHIRRDFGSVGFYYDLFGQTEDDEVMRLLQEANQRKGEAPCR